MSALACQINDQPNLEYAFDAICALKKASYSQALYLYDKIISDPLLDPYVVAQMGLHDRYFFAFHILGMHFMSKVARPEWVFDRCREVENNPDGCLDLWAREHLKSSLITFAGSLQEMAKDSAIYRDLDPVDADKRGPGNEITIGIFSHTVKIARDFLSKIKREMEDNQKLSRLYPDVFWADPKKQAAQWSRDDGLILQRESNPNEPTVSGWGLVDGLPTSKHFKLMIYDDVVTERSVTSAEMILKTTEAWELSEFLSSQTDFSTPPRKWHIGTRYCLIGETRILMADWLHKPIKDVKIGDSVVGWHLRKGSRYLKPSKVVNIGAYPLQKVFRYSFKDGSYVISTKDHRWWKGPHGSGDEYKKLGLHYHKMKKVRRLLTPVEPSLASEAGWLAGFFDGEGTVRKNPGHSSGSLAITQTEKHPELIDKLKDVLTKLNFEFTERIIHPANETWSIRHDFFINGGWKERYRFLNEVNPSRKEQIEKTLFSQLQTDPIDLISISDSGWMDVFWIETETGNYIAEGLCSSNSFADTYAVMLKRDVVKPRIYPATDTGTIDGKPVMLSQEQWADKVKKTSPHILACQMLQNPLAGEEQEFKPEWIRRWDIRPQTLNIAILVDPANSKKPESCNSAFVVVGMDAARNKYLLDGAYHKMGLDERWEMLKGLRNKWIKAVGVQTVTIGYERYGMQVDIDHFKKMMVIERCHFPIEEVNWPLNKGSHGKDDRIRRLIPDHKNWAFFYPYVGEPTSLQDKTISNGREYLVSKAIKRKDENGRIYDVVEKFMANEYLFFPATTAKDFMDAMSRVYDVDLKPPIIYKNSDTLPPEEYFET